MEKEKISVDRIKRSTFSKMIREADMARRASNKNGCGEYAAACLYLTTLILKNKKEEFRG